MRRNLRVWIPTSAFLHALRISYMQWTRTQEWLGGREVERNRSCCAPGRELWVGGDLTHGCRQSWDRIGGWLWLLPATPGAQGNEKGIRDVCASFHQGKSITHPSRRIKTLYTLSRGSGGKWKEGTARASLAEPITHGRRKQVCLSM